MPKRITGLLFVALALAARAQVQVGAGSFAVPADTPQVTADCAQKPAPAQWWATLISQPFSSDIYAHPLSVKAVPQGLQVGYPGAAVYTGKGFAASPAAGRILVGVAGLDAPAAQVAGYSHFSVTARWSDGTRLMEATFGHGLPFAYFKIQGGNAQVISSGQVWYDQDGTLGLTVAGKSYGVFAPTGSVWTGSGTLASSLSGKDYLSVAILPDSSVATLKYFRRYAFAFVVKTRVAWEYREPGARLVTTFSAQTQAKEGSETGTLFALLRHQWLETVTPLTVYAYQSARGEMKVAAGASFVTDMGFNGILPAMPDVGGDRAALKSLLDQEAVWNGGGDSYGEGKSFGRAAALAHLADLAGDLAKRDALLAEIKTRLEDWLTAGGDRQFYYHKNWSSLIGYPAAFGSDTRLNDHHFHYGYFLMAAAAAARFDKAWAAKWGGMVEMLIRDVDAWDDADPLFGRFRYFDPYEGHGWADGMGFDRGNDQESSSESMNCDAGIILWGMNTGNKALRDLGIFMYAHEARAVEQYWWDVDRATFPAGYAHNTVGMIWSNGGDYLTWFSAAPGNIHGINFLPITGASLYLGRHPDHVLRNYAEGNSGEWPDLFAEYLAFADGDKAAAAYGAGLAPEQGDSRAHAYQLIRSLQAAGRLNTAIAADEPAFAVFDKGPTRTYTAFNPSNIQVTVRFSDGFAMAVPPGAQETRQGPLLPIVAVRPHAPFEAGRRRVRAWLVDPALRPAFAPGRLVYDAAGRPRRFEAAGLYLSPPASP